MLEAVICTISASGTPWMNELIRQSGQGLADLSKNKGYKVIGHHMGVEKSLLASELRFYYGNNNLTVQNEKSKNPFAISAAISRSFKANVRRALEMGAECIVYTEGDKPDFVDEIPKLVNKMKNESAGIVLPVRSRKGFAKFPWIQREFEEIVDHYVGEAIGIRTDYTYGPRAFNRRTARLALTYPAENWGVQTFPVVAGCLQGEKLEIAEVPGYPQENYMQKYPPIMRNFFAHAAWRMIQNSAHIRAAHMAKNIR